VPNSHLKRERSRKREAKEQLVGESLSLKVLEVNQRRRRPVLSERASSERARRRLLEELEPEQVKHGVVRHIAHYGAFVDLGGMDGLLHISELDHKYVKHPSDLLQVGEEIEVCVLKVDRERQRVSLSRKRLLPDTWDEVTENLFAGDPIVGTVTSVVDYGAFVDVGAGVQGLLHVSEIPNRQLGLSELRAGSQVDVRVRRIDRQRHRVSLTIDGRFAIPR
jgi:ribosomal protein S1